MTDMQAIANALIKGDCNTVTNLCRAALEEGMPPEEILNQGLIAGMNVIGKRFKVNEVYVPEVLIAARAMKGGMEVLKPCLAAAGVQPKGTMVVGTVKGDLHDIGKNLVGMMLEGAGFKVVGAGREGDQGRQRARCGMLRFPSAHRGNTKAKSQGDPLCAQEYY